MTSTHNSDLTCVQAIDWKTVRIDRSHSVATTGIYCAANTYKSEMLLYSDCIFIYIYIYIIGLYGKYESDSSQKRRR